MLMEQVNMMVYPDSTRMQTNSFTLPLELRLSQIQTRCQLQFSRQGFKAFDYSLGRQFKFLHSISLHPNWNLHFVILDNFEISKHSRTMADAIIIV